MSEPVKKSAPEKIIIWLAVFLFAVLVATVAIPNIVKARSPGCGISCINTLHQIDAAANQFALEKGKTNGEAIHFPNDLTPYIKLTSEGKISACPQGGIYHISKVGETPTCSLGSTVTPAHVMP